MRIFDREKVFFPILILCVFLIAGLIIYADYGASADEHIQIEGAHLTWREIMRTLGLPYPKDFDDLGNLNDFQNRYYGYIAMLPVTMIEALRGFQMDSADIIALRHLWCFLTYFAAACLFALFIQSHFRNQYLTAASLLLLILQPRLFGDIFYNDRDLLLISWMLIFLFCFDRFTRKSSPAWILLSGLSLSLAVNTRIFGLSLLVFPFLSFLSQPKMRKQLLFFVFVMLFFLYVFYPIAWHDPLKALPDAVRHFLTQQRSLDTNYQARLLFMNQKIYEHEVPRYYLPVYILISTPLTHLVFAVLGMFLFFNEIIRKKDPVGNLYETGMLLIFAGILAMVFITRPTFYNGWRHFYFLSLPILFLAVRGISVLLLSSRRKWNIAGGMIILIFVCVTASWIIRVHPYQIMYLNPLVRERTKGKFDRDYWLISTPELLNVLNETVSEGEIRIFDIDAFVDYAKIGMPESVRERFSSLAWKPADEPVPFILYNYTNKQGNEQTFPGYRSVYVIERDGIKIAEIFEYDDNVIIPQDFSREGQSAAEYRFETDVRRAELYECSNYDQFYSLQFSHSEDGENWNGVPAAVMEIPNGFKFEWPLTPGYFRIEPPPEAVSLDCRKIFLRGE